MKNTIIRRAQQGDEPGIAKVHIQSWQEAYKGILDESFLNKLPAELADRTTMWTRTLANPKRWTWVAEGLKWNSL